MIQSDSLKHTFDSLVVTNKDTIFVGIGDTNDLSIYIALGALLVSSIAALVALFTFISNIRYKKIATKPKILVNTKSLSNDSKAIISIHNVGLGTAFIEDVKLYWKDELIGASDKIALNDMQTTFKPKEISVTHLYKYYSIKPSEEICILEFDNSNAHNFLGSERTVALLISELKFKIIYSSMYGVKFEATDKKQDIKYRY